MAKVMISVPEDVLARIDDRAKRRGMSRSEFLRVAAEREIERPTLEEIERAMAEGQELLSGLGPVDSAELIRQERDNRKY